MTTHISSQKHPVPPDRHADLVERCLYEYKASARRRSRNRILFCAIILIGIAIAVYYLITA